MNDLKNNIDQVKKLQSFKEEQRISFKKIELENIDFEYVLENKEKNILKNFNLEINKNDKIGIMGKTGTEKLL